MAEKQLRLAIKLNRVAISDPCAVCGERTDPQEGPELFLAEDDLVVCHECGRKYAPELVAALVVYRNCLERERRLVVPDGGGLAGELVAIPCAGDAAECGLGAELADLDLFYGGCGAVAARQAGAAAVAEEGGGVDRAGIWDLFEELLDQCVGEARAVVPSDPGNCQGVEAEMDGYRRRLMDLLAADQSLRLSDVVRRLDWYAKVAVVQLVGSGQIDDLDVAAVLKRADEIEAQEIAKHKPE